MTKPETLTPACPSRSGAAARLWRLARGGTASVVGSALSNNVLRIVSSMTLTRLLSSEAFGVAGILFSVSLVMQLISDVGLYDFIVRHEEGDDPRFLDEIWTIRLIRSAVLTLAMAALAWPIARFLGKPQLTPVFAAWSLNFVIEGAGSLSFATAVRQRRLWGLTAMELMAAVTQFVVSIGLALWLRSYWALVFAMLAGVVAKTIFSYRFFPHARRRFVIVRARAREVWAFSRFIALSSFLTLLILQSDKLVLARLMPLADYGHYAIAVTLATAPLPVALMYVNRILFPAYTEAMRGGAAALAAIFYVRRRWATLGFSVAAGGLIGGAPLLVAILYDHRYAAVAPFLQLVALSAIVALPNNAAQDALVAAKRVRWTLYANVARIAWLAGGGAAAWALHSIVALVAVVGTMEWAATAVFWAGLRRMRILNLVEEGLGFAAAAAGFGIGAVATRVAFAVIA